MSPTPPLFYLDPGSTLDPPRLFCNNASSSGSSSAAPRQQSKAHAARGARPLIGSVWLGTCGVASKGLSEAGKSNGAQIQCSGFLTFAYVKYVEIRGTKSRPLLGKVGQTNAGSRAGKQRHKRWSTEDDQTIFRKQTDNANKMKRRCMTMF